MPPTISLTLTPPKGGLESAMSPTTYLTRDGTVRSLKRQLQCDAIDPKRLRLEPHPAINETIVEYYTRNPAASVVAPFSPIMRNFEDRNNDLLSRIDKLEAREEKYLKIRANLHIGNMLITVCNKYLTKDTGDSATNKGASDHSTNRAIQCGRDAKKKDLAKAGIPSKFWPAIQDMGPYIKARNMSAHESYEEFAVILKEPCMQQYYDEWSGLFPIAYGATVEEVAEKSGQFLSTNMSEGR
ncbi:hypothetical protein MferCBS31731_002402 [Microsporum ferrugineum]